jgi:peptidyl-prolyl cis-trans isomerase D
MTVAPFEEAAFRLARGELSKPVRSQFGFHLIRLDDHEKERRAEFQTVRSEVEKSFREEESQRRLRSLARRLTLRLEAGESLAKAAEGLKLPMQTTGWFDRKSGIAGWKEAHNAVEALATRRPGQWLGPLYLGKDRQGVFEVTDEKEAPLPKTLDPQERALVENRLMDEKRSEWLEAFLKEQRKVLNVRVKADPDNG